MKNLIKIIVVGFILYKLLSTKPLRNLVIAFLVDKGATILKKQIG